MPTEAAIVEKQAEESVQQSFEQERVLVYQLLAALLREPPGSEQIAHLAELEVDSEHPGSESWRLLQMAARQIQGVTLEQEYQDLFIGVGRGELVPYGSWYQTGSLMERPLLILRRDLCRLGYQRGTEVKEPEDHVAALCEVMGLMICDGHGRDLQREFFTVHIEPWMGRFFTDLQGAAGAVFYRAVGYLGEQFIQLEMDYLEVV